MEIYLHYYTESNIYSRKATTTNDTPKFGQGLVTADRIILLYLSFHIVFFFLVFVFF